MPLSKNNKNRFMAEYGTVDWEKELDHSNPEPNQFIVKRPDATREHVMRALYHPNSYLAHLAAKTSLVKRSDLEAYLQHPKASEEVKKSIQFRFQADRMAQKNSSFAAHSKPYYPEDKE